MAAGKPRLCRGTTPTLDRIPGPERGASRTNSGRPGLARPCQVRLGSWVGSCFGTGSLEHEPARTQAALELVGLRTEGLVGPVGAVVFAVAHALPLDDLTVAAGPLAAGLVVEEEVE